MRRARVDEKNPRSCDETFERLIAEGFDRDELYRGELGGSCCVGGEGSGAAEEVVMMMMLLVKGTQQISHTPPNKKKQRSRARAWRSC